MDRICRGFSSRKLLIAPVLAFILLPVGPLSAQECGVSTGEPMVLRDQRIPFYEVLETFLLHAGVIYDTQGPEAYRAFLLEYGLDPELATLQELHRAFDDLQRSLHPFVGEVEHETARRVGEILAGVLADIEENDPRGVDAVRDLRLRLGTQLRPQMSWIFIDGNPNFSVLDEAEEHFLDTLEGAGAGIDLPKAPHHSGGSPDVTGPEVGSLAATRVKLSFLEREGPSLRLREETVPVHAAEVEWRSYARADGSARVIGLFRSDAKQLGLVDMTFQSGDRLRDELKQKGGNGFLRLVESFAVDESLDAKSHTSWGCISASAVVAAACAACAVPPEYWLSCSACAAAIAAAAVACNQPHCDQIQCNYSCVLACHQYGLCSSTSGSSTPADCQCYGLRFDTPGCGGGGGPGGCSAMVNEVSVLSFDGGDAVRLSTGPIKLSRLEESDEMHHGEEVSYLMEEWAVLAQGTPTAATDPAPAIRTLRTSSTDFAGSQAYRLRTSLAAAPGGSLAAAGRVSIVVASPPHEANSREIPMPDLKIASEGLRPGAVSGKIAIRADFSEAGDLADLRILHDTLGGVSPQLAADIERALSLQFFSEKRHRVVAFAVLSVGDSLEIDSKVVVLPKCCCGEFHCV